MNCYPYRTDAFWFNTMPAERIVHENGLEVCEENRHGTYDKTIGDDGNPWLFQIQDFWGSRE